MNQLKSTQIDIFQNIDPQYAKDDLQDIFKTLIQAVQPSTFSVETLLISVTNTPTFIKVNLLLFFTTKFRFSC